MAPGDRGDRCGDDGRPRRALRPSALLVACLCLWSAACLSPSPASAELTLSTGSLPESATELPLLLDLGLTASADGALIELAVQTEVGVLGAYVTPRRFQLQPGQSAAPIVLHCHYDPQLSPPMALTVTATPAALPACPLHDLDATQAGKAVFAPAPGGGDSPAAIASAFVRREQNFGFAQAGAMSVSFWALRTDAAEVSTFSGVFSFANSYTPGGACWVGWEADRMLAKCFEQAKSDSADTADTAAAAAAAAAAPRGDSGQRPAACSLQPGLIHSARPAPASARSPLLHARAESDSFPLRC
jgi:hypothetical protein